MLAFTNTKVTKQELLEVLRRHKEADVIVRGRYYRDGKGCAVGCSLHDFCADPRDYAAAYPGIRAAVYVARAADAAANATHVYAATNPCFLAGCLKHHDKIMGDKLINLIEQSPTREGL